jgi:RHS repeat-associated protein
MAGENAYLFTGQELDEETGFYNYNARLYDPEIGRFLSADTLVPGRFNSQAYNRYSYVFNNPLCYADPSGHSPEEDAANQARASAEANARDMGMAQINQQRDAAASAHSDSVSSSSRDRAMSSANGDYYGFMLGEYAGYLARNLAEDRMQKTRNYLMYLQYTSIPYGYWPSQLKGDREIDFWSRSTSGQKYLIEYMLKDEDFHWWKEYDAGAFGKWWKEGEFAKDYEKGGFFEKNGAGSSDFMMRFDRFHFKDDMIHMDRFPLWYLHMFLEYPIISLFGVDSIKIIPPIKGY